MFKKPIQLFSKVLLATLLCGTALQAAALEFRSIAEHGAVFYDMPGGKGKPLFSVSKGYPVEVLTTQKDWARVRDQGGALAWIAARQLSENRTLVVVKDHAELHAQPDSRSPVLVRADKNVLFDLVEPGKSGWVKVHHRDGVVGYFRLEEVWGL